MNKDRQNWKQRLAYLLPNEVVYYVLIRAWAYATTGKYSNEIVGEVTADEMIRRWGSENKRLNQQR